ncbi:MAG: nucleotide exchange factor GrpE [Oscillospiraceae bacterium]|nr:nucleotide exchange factor GrpE [Oscillospiraceae bacterium]
MAKKKNDETLEEKVEIEEASPSLEEELAAQKERYLRLAAEYENFRKRSARERESLSCLVKSDTVAALLPVADNLHRALSATGDEQNLRKGIELTVEQLNAAFEKLGVESFGEKGEAFDPAFHDAMAAVPDTELPENTITEVYSVGYKIVETVIRHAKVIVAS